MSEENIEQEKEASKESFLPRWWRVGREITIALGILVAMGMFWLTYTQQLDQSKKFQAERRTELIKYLYDVDASGKPLASSRLRSEAFMELLALDSDIWGGAGMAGASLQDTGANCIQLKNVSLDEANTSDVHWDYVLIENSRITIGPGTFINRAVIRDSFITVAHADDYYDDDYDPDDGDKNDLPAMIMDSYISGSQLYSQSYKVNAHVSNTFFSDTKVTKWKNDPAVVVQGIEDGTHTGFQLFEEITFNMPDGFRDLEFEKVFTCEDCEEATLADTTFKGSKNYLALTEEEWTALVHGDPSEILAKCPKREWDVY